MGKVGGGESPPPPRFLCLCNGGIIRILFGCLENRGCPNDLLPRKLIQAHRHSVKALATVLSPICTVNQIRSPLYKDKFHSAMVATID